MDNINEYAVYLALGSNLGDKQKNIEEALDKINERIGNVVSLSAFYLTLPEGFQSDNVFVNCVCEVVSNMDIFDLFAETQLIEKEIGRSTKSDNGLYEDRVIDIDLIMAGNIIIDTPQLTIPHPLFHKRSFVIDPLFEIAPEIIHPLLKKSVRSLREELLKEVERKKKSYPEE